MTRNELNAAYLYQVARERRLREWIADAEAGMIRIEVRAQCVADAREKVRACFALQMELYKQFHAAA
jgi:hypothetical protein